MTFFMVRQDITHLIIYRVSLQEWAETMFKVLEPMKIYLPMFHILGQMIQVQYQGIVVLTDTSTATLSDLHY